jgi:hypothetical protein
LTIASRPGPTCRGEWADDLTPLSLAYRVMGDAVDESSFEVPSAEIIDAIADAFERGVDDTFQVECERILRATVQS